MKVVRWIALSALCLALVLPASSFAQEKSVVNLYDYVKDLKEIIFSILGAGTVVFSTLAGLQVWNVSRAKAEFLAEQNRSKDEFRADFKDAMASIRKAQDQVDSLKERFGAVIEEEREHLRKNIDDQLIRVRESIASLRDVYAAWLRLTSVVPDVDEPSIRHPRDPTQQLEIKRYLAEVDKYALLLRDKLKRQPGDTGMALRLRSEELFNTSSDFRTIGRAHFYIYKNDRAREYFEKELELIKYENNQLPTDAQDLHALLNYNRADALRRVGNCYAGQEDYPRALQKYDAPCREMALRLDDKTPSDLWLLDIKTQISRVDAYQGSHRYGDAIDTCVDIQSKICKRTASTMAMEYPSKEIERCYWEATFQLARAHTASGEYDKAEKQFKLLCQEFRRVEKAVEPFFIYLTYAHCLWKSAKARWGEARNFLDQADIARALTRRSSGMILYRRARLDIAQELYEDAEGRLREIIDNRYEVDSPNKVALFYGYSQREKARKLGNVKGEGAGQDAIAKAVSDMKRTVDKAKDKQAEFGGSSKDQQLQYSYLTCGPHYERALGLGLQPDEPSKNEALDLLKELSVGFPCVKKWAIAADCADFPLLKKHPRFDPLRS